jgi:hypothetical protein
MTTVSNPSADADEKIERAARVLRASKQNLEVFKAVYGNSARFKTIDQIKRLVANANTNTYKAANRLYGEDIVEKRTRGHEVAYGKKDFYTIHRDRILRLVKNPGRLKAYPTKRKVRINSSPKIHYAFQSKPKVRQIYVDDIDSFSRARGKRPVSARAVQQLSERAINAGICKILNQNDKKDWGGERNDIYSNKVVFNGSRKSGAFALKGKAVKSKLVPGKMGKNGDQIQRLFEATADIYFVVHNREIDERIVDLMQVHALGKSIAQGRRVYFCIVDGDDLARLVCAYPTQFGLNI